MSQPYQVYADIEGNLNVMDGIVIDRLTGAIFRTGQGVAFGHGAAAREYLAAAPAASSADADFVGGSTRNLLGSGLATAAGFWRAERPGEWRLGGLLLVVTGPSAATISDATNVVAILSTGGTAPVGNYPSTTYGAATYNATAAFTVALAEEQGAPGPLPPDAEVSISEGTAMGGVFEAVDTVNYVSVANADWTILVLATGEARMFYQATRVATRVAGSPYDPDGTYVAEASAYFYNPQEPEQEPLADLPETNPFGILTLTYSWPATPDLDNTTRFLGESVGYGTGFAGTYLTHSGDDTDPAGSEVVTVDLAQAWADGEIETEADIVCFADWFPPRGGSGPATLDISYSLGGTLSLTIHPGSTATPATTFVRAIRVTAAGAIQTPTAVWYAEVRRIARPPREGVVYIELTETAGLLTSVAGPFLATTMPASGSGVFRFPLAISDGAGGIEQVFSGTLVWG
jgi:hypothetical protein